ncbi:MAG: hypothetical protein WC325_12305 [Candidatus Bathyarchaeia archaeon]|jgi:hypothetical protein
MKYALTDLLLNKTRILHLAHISRITNKHIRTLQKYIKYDGYYQDTHFLVTPFQQEHHGKPRGRK